jgi:hypothetical protein
MVRKALALAIVVIATSLVGSAAYAQPATLAEDFAVGSGSTGGLFSNIVIDARSDPSGGNARGAVSFVVFGTLPIGGPVTCLAVDSNVALIGFDDTTSGFGATQALIIDNAGTGLPDVFGAAPSPGVTDCSSQVGMPLETLATGDFVVHDAAPLTSRQQCFADGWQQYTDAQGQPFKNQGQCVAFVEQRVPQTP